MIDTLVVFGDSWSWGAELRDPMISDLLVDTDPRNTQYRHKMSYPGILADALGLKLVNLSGRGQSLLSMCWCFINWLENSITDSAVVLAGLTHPVRTSWWDAAAETDLPNKFVHTTTADFHKGTNSQAWKDMHKLWTTLCMSAELEQLTYSQSICTFVGGCVNKKIPFLLFDIYQHDRIDNFGIVPKFNCQSLLGNKQDNSHLWYNNHPSEAGHQKIAQHLLPLLNFK